MSPLPADSRLPRVTEARELSRIGADYLDIHLSPYQADRIHEENDYGVDGSGHLVRPDDAGNLRYLGTTFQYQLKSRHASSNGLYMVDLEVRHLLLWLSSNSPVVIFLVSVTEDGQSATTHWRCVDRIFEQWLSIERPRWREQATVSVPFGPEDVFDRTDRSLFESTIINWRGPEAGG